ncbi:MAG: Lipid A core-O-antigen ligase, partial [Candidatus Uhrbacteria bacterium GW2011_GWD2_52_7]
TPILLAIYLAFSGLVVHQIVDSADQTFSERFFEVFSLARFQGEYDGLGRTYWIVQTLITVVPAAPLFGHGPASYGGGAVAALGNGAVYDQLGLPFGVYGTEGYIDNNWLSLWGEVGTFGLVAYLLMFGALFRASLRVYRRSTNPETRALALGFCAAMIAVTLNAFLATFLEVRTLAVYLWIFGGLVVTLGQKEGIV